MITIDLEERTRAVIDAWNRADWSTYRAATAPAFVHEEHAFGSRCDDVEEVVRRWRRVTAVYPDTSAEIRMLARLGSTTRAVVTWRATQSAPTPDGAGFAPPTYKTVVTQDVITMDWRDGLLAAEQHRIGFLSLMAPLQLI
ncbi:nuclear transport factor 2 family protein [Pseudonocardia sp. CA-107938]|uniref:nuclear transport factor 2 family protein n=1 Tax=Pseudonocardia sp. CA-107938 TaxID=3240021 RepID=UPI003D8A762A